ncbi:MAG: orotate phosphoribosyltransferase [Candidatus Heimdallarchaeaceae archaeon]
MMTSKVDKKELSTLLTRYSIIRFGEFTLKSGRKSWYYIDLRLIPSFPEVFRYVIKCYKELISSLENIDGFAGVAVAGVPFSSVLGFEMSLPSLIVRPETKEHGRKRQVEGVLPPNSNVVLIDDLITTGGSKIPSINALRDAGYKVNDLVVLVNRSEGNLDEIKEVDVRLHAFVDVEEIFRTCLSLDDTIIPPEQKEIIERNWKG